MKTKVFNVWTKSVEDFIESVPYNQQSLSDWFDEQGAQLFEVGQREFFQAHIKDYVEVESPGDIKYNLAADQIRAGFEKVYSAFVNDFPLLATPGIVGRFKGLSIEATSDKYAALIACRAVITAQSTKPGAISGIEKLKRVIESFQLLQQGVNASIESMQSHLEKIASAPVASASASPTLYKLSPATQSNQISGQSHLALKK